MPRHPRIVVPGVAHHVTQRSNKKANIFFSPEDRLFFLELLMKYAEIAQLEIVSFCLMTNHTHLIVVPREKDSLSKAFKPVHMRYSQRLNKRATITGVNWQGRFFSSPMDQRHTFIAIQYLCLNPVRAGLVNRVEDYQWSSAKAHLYNYSVPPLTTDPKWLSLTKKAVESISYKSSKNQESFKIISRNTKMNIPVGSEDFVRSLEDRFNRNLGFKKRGRPGKG
jgi:putative transposase